MDKKLTPMMEMNDFIEEHSFNATLESGEKLLVVDLEELKQKIAIQIEKERQMAIDAYMIGISNVGNSFSYEAAKKAKEYYTQTYKS
jgi:hypothetical protein